MKMKLFELKTVQAVRDIIYAEVVRGWKRSLGFGIELTIFQGVQNGSFNYYIFEYYTKTVME